MELLVLLGLVIVIYCGYETCRDLMSPLRKSAKNLHHASLIFSASLKRLVNDYLKHLHPHYRLTSAYCVHTHRIHVESKRLDHRAQRH